MDGENNGKPYEQMDDLKVPPIFGSTPINQGQSSVVDVFLCCKKATATTPGPKELHPKSKCDPPLFQVTENLRKHHWFDHPYFTTFEADMQLQCQTLDSFQKKLCCCSLGRSIFSSNLTSPSYGVKLMIG